MQISSKAKVSSTISSSVCVLLLAACSNGSNFGGSGGKAAEPVPAAAAPSAASATAATPQAASSPATATEVATAATVSTGTAPAAGNIDISQTGFQCSPEMQTAAGNWSGTYVGEAVALLPVSGFVNFAFAYKDAETMSMQNFYIYGGLFGGDEIKSIAIDFDLHCGDLNLQNAVVQHAGLTVNVALALTGQSWDPPTLSGTWKAATEGVAVGVASGTWMVGKNP